MTERESQYPFEKIWIDVRKILIYRTDYITHNMKLQSGAGVPPTLLHYYLLLITFQKSTQKISQK